MSLLLGSSISAYVTIHAAVDLVRGHYLFTPFLRLDGRLCLKQASRSCKIQIGLLSTGKPPRFKSPPIRAVPTMVENTDLQTAMSGYSRGTVRCIARHQVHIDIHGVPSLQHAAFSAAGIRLGERLTSPHPMKTCAH